MESSERCSCSEPLWIDDYTRTNRHTFASRLATSGQSIQTIAALMGHSTIQMTMRYAHLSPPHNQTAVDGLVWFGMETGPGLERK